MPTENQIERINKSIKAAEEFERQMSGGLSRNKTLEPSNVEAFQVKLQKLRDALGGGDISDGDMNNLRRAVKDAAIDIAQNQIIILQEQITQLGLKDDETYFQAMDHLYKALQKNQEYLQRLTKKLKVVTISQKMIDLPDFIFKKTSHVNSTMQQIQKDINMAMDDTYNVETDDITYDMEQKAVLKQQELNETAKKELVQRRRIIRTIKLRVMDMSRYNVFEDTENQKMVGPGDWQIPEEYRLELERIKKSANTNGNTLRSILPNADLNQITESGVTKLYPSIDRLEKDLRELSLNIGDCKIRTLNKSMQTLAELREQAKNAIPDNKQNKALGSNKALLDIIQYAKTMDNILDSGIQSFKQSRTNVSNLNMSQVKMEVEQRITDVEILEEKVKNYKLQVAQELKESQQKHNVTNANIEVTLEPVNVLSKDEQQQQEYKKEPDKHNAILFKSVMNAVAGEHTKYETEAEASKFAINKSRKKTMKLVESHAKIIANDKNLKSSDKVTLLIGLLEANRKAVSHNEANKSIFAKIGSKGKAKGSRLVSKYDNVLKIAKAQANKQGFKFKEKSNPEAIRLYEKFAQKVAQQDIDDRINLADELGF